MFGFGYGFDSSIIVLIPAIIFTIWAQAKVNGTFRRYSGIRNSRGITGAQAARVVLDSNGLQNVEIRHISGNLTDHYNPANRTLNLSDSVCNSDSIAAVGVACHEAGHAIQHARHYVPLVIRNSIVPVVNIASGLSWILIIAGIVLTAGYQSAGGSGTGLGNFLFNIGVIAFVAVVFFHLITLPVEFNASSRAIKLIREYQLVDGDEINGAKRVLRAAAMTYVAALASAVASLIRILLIRGRN
jgi:Zn-dependent membrane protease YugP